MCGGCTYFLDKCCGKATEGGQLNSVSKMFCLCLLVFVCVMMFTTGCELCGNNDDQVSENTTTNQPTSSSHHHDDNDGSEASGGNGSASPTSTSTPIEQHDVAFNNHASIAVSAGGESVAPGESRTWHYTGTTFTVNIDGTDRTTTDGKNHIYDAWDDDEYPGLAVIIRHTSY